MAVFFNNLFSCKGSMVMKSLRIIDLNNNVHIIYVYSK